MAGDPRARARTLLRTAGAAIAAGRLDDAAAAYREALRLFPGDLGSRGALGVVLHGLDRYAEAEHELRLATAADDDDLAAYAQAWLAAAISAQGRPGEALDEARAAVARAPGLQDAHERLAAVALTADEGALALDAATRACELGESGATHALRGEALAGLGRLDEAIAAYLRAGSLDPDTPEQPLAACLLRAGRNDEAVVVLRRLLAGDPDDASVRHNLAAISGEQTSAPPPGYVVDLFDVYAARFEAHLVDQLAYRGHVAVRAALGDERAGRALDLGCGTGLVGVLIRALVDELTGVDLAPKMIEAARAKGVYDALAVADVVDFLDLLGPDRRFDVITCADVLTYVGDPAPLLAAVAARLAPGGRFAFTIERGDAAWRLEATARYSHAPAHVEALAARHGLAVAHREELILREQDGIAVPALVYLLRAAALT